MRRRRRRYSRNFMRWVRHFAADRGAKPDRAGLEQFQRFETHGERPASPTPFFHRLAGGRSMYNALQKAVRATYGTPEWQGLEHDRQTMPAWLFRAFYGWHPAAARPVANNAADAGPPAGGRQATPA